jgi:hypothetical protein
MGFCQEAVLTNIVVTNTRDDLLLYLNVEGAFTSKMKKAILSGVPTTFSFMIALYKVRTFWYDKKLTEKKITNTIKYDSLKKQFIIKRSWKSNDPVVTESITEAKDLMTDIDSLKIISLSKLEKGEQYQIRAKAQLDELTLPFYLHYVFFFVSLWDFETDWYTIDFIY